MSDDFENNKHLDMLEKAVRSLFKGYLPSNLIINDKNRKAQVFYDNRWVDVGPNTYFGEEPLVKDGWS